MNYHHLFHAGNFSDVIKHVFLMGGVMLMQKKPTPLCYIDTHAGPGNYDLFSGAAAKTKEYKLGIEKVIQQDNPPAWVKRYIHIVHQINNELSGSKYASLRFYPGSPLLVKHMLRSQDQMIASELQPQAYDVLRSTFQGDKQVSVHHMDGYLGLKAFIPPRAKRGIVLIDPPYENPAEFNQLAKTLPMALKRWATGVYMIWYPIKEKTQLQRFYRQLTDHISNPILAIEITIFPDLPNHLNGCGLAVVNFPYQFDVIAQDVAAWLWKALSVNKQGSFSVKRLN